MNAKARNQKIERLARHLVNLDRDIAQCVKRAAKDSQAWEQLESLGLEKAETNEELDRLLAEVDQTA